jgi:hypothetical protein
MLSTSVLQMTTSMIINMACNMSQMNRAIENLIQLPYHSRSGS